MYIRLTELSNSLFVETNKTYSPTQRPYSPARSDNTTTYNTTIKNAKDKSFALSNKKIKKNPFEPINLDEEIKKLIDDPRRHMHIIGLFLREVPPSAATYGALRTSIKRNVRVASQLEGYPDKLILDAMAYAESEANENKFDWTLETALKKINRC